MKTINRIHQRIRQHILASIRLARRKVELSPYRHNVLLELNDRALARANKGRYLFMFVKFLELGGCNVDLRINKRDIGLFESEKFMRWILESKFVSINSSKLDNHDIVIKDKHSSIINGEHILLKFGYNIKRGVDFDVMIPFSMHPEFYHKDEWNIIREMRDEERVIKLMFAGNSSEKNYGNPGMMIRFGKPSRYESLVSCIKKLPVLEVNGTEDWLRLSSEGNKEKLCIIESQKFRIPKHQWLPTLAKTDFFLALPGVKMPMSHNAVEAMAVGCIPVLSYPEMFDPPLEDGVNCIVYTDITGLIEGVQRALNMDDDQVSVIRSNAQAYYDEYLTPARFVDRILNRKRRGLNLGMPYFNGT